MVPCWAISVLMGILGLEEAGSLFPLPLLLEEEAECSQAPFVSP